MWPGVVWAGGAVWVGAREGSHTLLHLLLYLCCLPDCRSPDNHPDYPAQVKTWYDRSRQELIVTVLSAVDLEPRVGGQYRNPYAKLFLLPDRRSAPFVCSKSCSCFISFY